jgi:hypothetical protein
MSPLCVTVLSPPPPTRCLSAVVYVHTVHMQIRTVFYLESVSTRITKRGVRVKHVNRSSKERKHVVLIE